ncbi:sulfatase-like hydrolase/transferase [Pontibacter sp. G13]|uniref:sulfatase-like hydrolase/transferase n=1 Tax=Pontibacter sp. G13 TaxID=3074898 RepID=UPI002889A1DE|nr:sulfatase-like hydrolase/transferase [Pontibacter sp. G13]WNJ17701.1 sulfatase-like hydrolase/transferase [Pontibacter sp. G13]
MIPFFRKRRRQIACSGFLAMLAGLTSCQLSEPSQSVPLPPPNILWLVAEDVSPRFDFYGDSLATTPHISALAERGVVFERAFTVSGVCAPSRSGIITGCYPTSIGTQHMRQQKSVIPMPGFPRYSAVPPPDVKAFPELLRSVGYWTSTYRKTDYQFGEPFTIWDEVSDDPHWRHRKEADQDKPFFVYATFEITHEINIWPDSTKSRFYQDFDLDTLTLAPDVLNRPPLLGSPKVDPARVMVPPYLPDTETSRSHIARLYDNISRMDHQVGRLMADLEADGLLENTIVFFMSDHGDCLPRGKRWIYDSGIHSPLVIHIPEAYRDQFPAQPARRTDLVSFIDLAPTVLALAGISKPDWMHGEDLLETLSETPRAYIFAGRDRMDNRYDTRRAIRSDRYKYIFNYQPETPYQQPITFLEQMPLMAEILQLHQAGQLVGPQAQWLADVKPQAELYDLMSDPYELHNLIELPALDSVKTAMHQALVDWQAEFHDLEDEDERLQAERAWPGGTQPITETPTYDIQHDQVTLTCATEGATIAYRTSDHLRWEIYQGPIPLTDSLIVKAQRYGYETSPAMLITPQLPTP